MEKKELKSRLELTDLLRPGSVIAEVGVAEGNFSRDMAGSENVARIIMVDYWGSISGVTGDGSFNVGWHRGNMVKAAEVCDRFPDKAVMIKAKSVFAAGLFPDNYFDMVYLDAGHYFSAVMADLNAWYQKVKKNGIIAGHDYLSPDYDVKDAVSQFIVLNQIITNVNVIPENGPTDASFYFYKP